MQSVPVNLPANPMQAPGAPAPAPSQGNIDLPVQMPDSDGDSGSAGYVPPSPSAGAMPEQQFKQ